MYGVIAVIAWSFVVLDAMLQSDYFNSKPQPIITYLENEWINWKSRHKIKFKSIEEDIFRFSIFQDNLLKAKIHNADKTQTYFL